MGSRLAGLRSSVHVRNVNAAHVATGCAPGRRQLERRHADRPRAARWRPRSAPPPDPRPTSTSTRFRRCRRRTRRTGSVAGESRVLRTGVAVRLVADALRRRCRRAASAQVWLPTMPSSSQPLALLEGDHGLLRGGAELVRTDRCWDGHDRRAAVAARRPIRRRRCRARTGSARQPWWSPSRSWRRIPRRYALGVHCAPGARRDEGPFGQPPVHRQLRHDLAVSGYSPAHGVHRHPAGGAGLLRPARGGQLEGVLGGQQGRLPRRGQGVGAGALRRARRVRTVPPVPALQRRALRQGPTAVQDPARRVRRERGRRRLLLPHLARGTDGGHRVLRDDARPARALPRRGRCHRTPARRSPGSWPGCRSATGSARSTS